MNGENRCYDIYRSRAVRGQTPSPKRRAVTILVLEHAVAHVVLLDTKETMLIRCLRLAGCQSAISFLPEWSGNGSIRRENDQLEGNLS
jgi:hypothetical protein